jgi:LmbE family N-acetylglucosaminyl deacetylase
VTTSFDHRLPGTDARMWVDGRLDDLDRLGPPGPGDRLLVVAAHPDDESLGAGGLIATALANGAQVSLLVVSDGEASHPSSPTHTAARLAAVRRAEVTAAMARLGPGVRIRFAAIADGSIADNQSRLAELIAAEMPYCTHVITPWIGDRHPDHETCARVAADLVAGRAVEHWQYPIWAWHWADPDAPNLPLEKMSRIDLSPSAQAAKLAALSCHRSQHTALSDAPADQPVLPPNVLAHFQRDFECFIRTKKICSAPAASTGYFDHLYDGADDPWRLTTSFYERRKLSLLLASLPRERFARAFEPGCALGLLTVQLAERCDELIAWDGASSAIAQTRARLGERTDVILEQRRIPREYLRQLAGHCRQSLTDDGVIVACHWTHPARDHPQTAQAVHAMVGAGLHRIAQHTEADFLLDVWSRDSRSVAALDGVVR